MQRYIAFLSGLPVGKNSVSMGTLRTLFSKLGYLEVETFLTTGNVVFLTAPVGIIAPFEAQLSRYLTKVIGDDIGVFLRTPGDLTKIAEYEPPDGEVFVVLLHHQVPAEIAKRLARVTASSDQFEAHGREIYWLRPPRTAGATTKPLELAHILEVPATVRSLNTVKRLAAKYNGAIGSGRSRR